MNPDSQPGESSGGGEEVKPSNAASMRHDYLHSLPAAAAPPSLPAQPVPEEQHFFRRDGAPEASVQPQPTQLYDTPQPADIRMQHVGESVSWTASEFIAHEKSTGWYLKFGGVALLVTAIVGLITRDVFSVIVLIIVGAIFGYAAGRMPRQMRYTVDDHGIMVGRRVFLYKDFRGFSVIQEGSFQSITLMPLKRFMPAMNIYFDPADEDRILQVLTAYLPLEAPSHDPIDRLMRRIRF